MTLCLARTRMPSCARRAFAARSLSAEHGSLSTKSPLVLEQIVHSGDVPLQLFIAMDGDATQTRPANGGLRLWSYETEGAAVEEAERLASG